MEACKLCGEMGKEQVMLRPERPRTNLNHPSSWEDVGPFCADHIQVHGGDDWVKLELYLEALLREWEIRKNQLTFSRAGVWRAIEVADRQTSPVVLERMAKMRAAKAAKAAERDSCDGTADNGVVSGVA